MTAKTIKVQATVEFTEDEYRVLCVEAAKHNLGVAGMIRALGVLKAWALLADERDMRLVEAERPSAF